VDEWPLVGRDEELAQLAAAVVAQRGAVITGAGGVGKTTLAMAGLRVAEGRGISGLSLANLIGHCGADDSLGDHRGAGAEVCTPGSSGAPGGEVSACSAIAAAAARSMCGVT
jgi:hypothetical protein